MTMGSLDTGDTVPDEAGQNHEEPHGAGMAGRLNWLRAGVLGANDGIVSTAGIVIGVAGATANRSVILTAGIAGLAAGALSMAVGEYVSVSTQRDTERALLAKERRELHEMPDEELAELTEIYVGKGLSPDVAALVARQLTDHDALGAHAEAELGINPDELSSPWHAAFASLVAFTVGALLPLLAIALPPPVARVAGDRRRRRAGAGVHRRRRRPAGARALAAAGAAQRGRRAAGHGHHLRHREPGRHRGLAGADPLPARRHQKRVPGSPLNGPTTRSVTQPP